MKIRIASWYRINSPPHLTEPGITELARVCVTAVSEYHVPVSPKKPLNGVPLRHG